MILTLLKTLLQSFLVVYDFLARILQDILVRYLYVLFGYYAIMPWIYQVLPVSILEEETFMNPTHKKNYGRNTEHQ